LKAVDLGAEYVDIELSTGDALIEELLQTIRSHDNQTRLIVSSHDFSKTPSEARLKARFNECIEAGAGIVKIAAYAKSVEDNLKVLSLIPYGRRKEKKVIAFCMGKLGRISRVVAPLLGSYLSFASIERGYESAPGILNEDNRDQTG
jgi:3-dehydroquinate dehydratase